MRSARYGNHVYQLVLDDDGQGGTRTIEFEAEAPDAALFFAGSHCGGREIELFEDERSLGRLKCVENGGFWVISPPAANSAQG